MIVHLDPLYFRPKEVETLLWEATTTTEKLGWEPKTTLRELVTEMVEVDLAATRRDVSVKCVDFVRMSAVSELHVFHWHHKQCFASA